MRLTGCLCLFVAVCIISSSHAFDIETDLVFRLYTRENPVTYHALKVSGSLSIAETPFNPNRPTRIFVHGFRGDPDNFRQYEDAYLMLGNYNFIAVDWIEGADTFQYTTAKDRVDLVAEKLAGLIDDLVAKGMKLPDVTMVGHSLGAHIAGRAAKLLKSDGKIGCIVGLDPASVGFNFFELSKRLSDTDADYVQIIHTDGEKFGIAEPIGHADFYPNGGKYQPGCPKRNRLANLIEKCNHARVHDLFLESLFMKFEAIQCVSYEEIQKNHCTFFNATSIMGGEITKRTLKPHGIFYLETNSQSPYNIPDYKNFKNIQLVIYK